VTARTCVIYNPAAGRGKAGRLLDAARAWLPPFEVRPTTAQGHAVKLAAQAARDGYERVVAAGGDGTAHEVANGILTSGIDTLFSSWPLGSSNDYARATGLSDWWKRRGEVALGEIRADIGEVTAGERSRYFVNGSGVGFNGMVTVEAHRIDWLRGAPLYTLAFLRALRKHYATPTYRVTLDGVTGATPTLSLSVNLGPREGGFPVTPDARLDDGLFDTFHPGALARWELIRYLPSLVAGRLPKGHPRMGMGTCRAAAVGGDTPLCVHADGELVCVPSDGVRRVTWHLHPARLRVEVAWASRDAGRLGD